MGMGIIIPIDELIFCRGVETATTNQGFKRGHVMTHPSGSGYVRLGRDHDQYHEVYGFCDRCDDQHGVPKSYGYGSKVCTPVVHIKIAGIYGCE